MPRPVLAKPTGIKEPVTCPECRRQLGQIVDGIFVLSFTDRRVQGKRTAVGFLPAMIVCEDCGGVWLNPAWDFADNPYTILAAIQNLAYLSPPSRDWRGIEAEKRPQRWR